MRVMQGLEGDAGLRGKLSSGRKSINLPMSYRFMYSS